MMSSAHPYGGVPGIGAGMPATAPQQPTPAPPAGNDPNAQMRVVVGPLVLAYPKLFTPAPRMNSNDPNDVHYSMEGFIYSSNPKAQEILQKLGAAASYAAAAEWQGRQVNMTHQPIRLLSEKEGYVGEPGWFIRANSKQKPSVVKGEPIVPATQDDIYAGCLVYVSLKADAYDQKGSRGVKWFLNSVWKVAEGTPLAAARTGEQDFSHLVGQVPVSIAQTGPDTSHFAQQFVPQPSVAMQNVGAHMPVAEYPSMAATASGLDKRAFPPQHPNMQAPPQYPSMPAPPQYQGMQAPPQYQGMQAPPQYQGMQAPPQYQGMQAPPQYQGMQAPPQYSPGPTGFAPNM